MNETDRALSVTPKASPIVPWGLLYKTDRYELNQDQKQAIIEVLTEGAGFCILGVGAGKTLLSFLLTKIFDLKTILLCPADLRDNAHTEFDKFKNDFDHPCTMYIQFLIRDYKLHLIWNMRSCDLICMIMHLIKKYKFSIAVL